MDTVRSALLLTLMVLTWLAPARAADAPADGPYEEKWPNGKTKIQTTYKGGQLNGAYTENYESGKTHIKALYKDGKREGPYTENSEAGFPKLTAAYKNGELNGAYAEFDDKGQPHVKATYAAGKRHGSLTEFAADGRTVTVQIDYDKGVPKKINGADVFPKTKDAILAEIKAIYKGHEFTGTHDERFSDKPSSALPLKAGGLKKTYEEDGLAYMNVYRFLAGVPYKQLRLDPENSKFAQAIAVLCQYQFDIKAWPPANPHHPPQLPEVDRAFWTAADKGGHGSNIYDHHKPEAS
ncbi:MAG TPA: hypothetical protein VL860_04470, partial [Planctomycetota bacterium]|nr:hypothetical protein [Planctomycetota bacterium]